MALKLLMSQSKQLDIDADVTKDPFNRQHHEASIKACHERCSKAPRKSFEPLMLAWKRLQDQGGMLLSMSEYEEWLSNVESYGGPNADVWLSTVTRDFHSHWHGNEASPALLLSYVAKETSSSATPSARGSSKMTHLKQLLLSERYNFQGFPAVVAEALLEQEGALDGRGEDDVNDAELKENDDRVKELYRFALATTHHGWYETRESYEEWASSVGGEEDNEAENETEGDAGGKAKVLCRAPKNQEEFTQFEEDLQIALLSLKSNMRKDQEPTEGNAMPTASWAAVWKAAIELAVSMGQDKEDDAAALVGGRGTKSIYNGWDRAVLLCRRCLSVTVPLLTSTNSTLPAAAKKEAEAAQRTALYTLIDLVKDGDILKEFFFEASPPLDISSSTGTVPPETPLDVSPVPTAAMFQAGLCRQLLHYTTSVQGIETGLTLQLLWALVAHGSKAEGTIIEVVRQVLRSPVCGTDASEAMIPRSMPVSLLAQLLDVMLETAVNRDIPSSSEWAGLSIVKSLRGHAERLVATAKAGQMKGDTSFSAGLLGTCAVTLYELEAEVPTTSTQMSSSLTTPEHYLRANLISILPMSLTHGDAELLRLTCSTFIRRYVEKSKGSSDRETSLVTASSLRTLVSKRVSGTLKFLGTKATEVAAATTGRDEQSGGNGEFRRPFNNNRDNSNVPEGGGRVGFKRERPDEDRQYQNNSNGDRDRMHNEEPYSTRRRMEGGSRDNNDAAPPKKKPLRDDDALSICIPNMLVANGELRVKNFLDSCPGGVAVVDLQPNKKDPTQCFAFVQLATEEGLAVALALSGTEMVQGDTKTLTRKVKVTKYEPKPNSFVAPQHSGGRGGNGVGSGSRGGRGRGAGDAAFQQRLLGFHGSSTGTDAAPKGKGFFDSLFGSASN